MCWSPRPKRLLRLVPGGGVEPPRPEGRRILRDAVLILLISCSPPPAGRPDDRSGKSSLVPFITNVPPNVDVECGRVLIGHRVEGLLDAAKAASGEGEIFGRGDRI
jgi:hypothetical protein